MLKQRVLAMALAVCLMLQSMGMASYAAETTTVNETIAEEIPAEGEDSITEELSDKQEEKILEPVSSEEPEQKDEITEESETDEKAEEEAVTEEIETLEEEVTVSALEAASGYQVDTSLGYTISDIKANPGSYHADFSFSCSGYLDYWDVKIIFTTDPDLKDSFFPDVTYATTEDIEGAGFDIGPFSASSFGWKNSGYVFEGTFDNYYGLEPNTTYYYRIVYADRYNSYARDDWAYGYYFLSEPMEFTTNAEIESSQLSVQDLAIESCGYNKAIVTWTLDNPQNEFVLSSNFQIVKDEETTESVWANEYWDSSSGKKVPGKYYAEIATNNTSCTGYVQHTTYTGNKVETSVKSKSITITPLEFTGASVQVTEEISSGSFTVGISVLPWIENDSLRFRIFYRKQGTVNWSSSIFAVTNSEEECKVTGLDSGTTYEYYLELSCDNSGECKLWTEGTEDSPLKFTTKQTVYYEDSEFPDEAFRNHLKKKVGIGESEQLSDALLESVTYIYSWNMSLDQPLSSIKGVQYCKNLESLSLDGQNIKEAGMLSSLTKLKNISLRGNDLTSMPDLSALKGLDSVSLDQNLLLASSITAEKLPEAFLTAYPYWVTQTRNEQRGEVSFKLAETYYAIGETRPFLAQIDNVKSGRTYTLSVQIGDDNYYSAPIKGDGILIISDLGIGITSGEQTVNVTVTDEYGKIWAEQKNQKVQFADDIRKVETIYVAPDQGDFYASVKLNGSYEDYTGMKLELLDQEKNVLGNCQSVDGYPYDREDRYNGVFDYWFDLPVENNKISGWIYLNKYLSAGAYDLRLTDAGGETFLYEDAVKVSGTAVVEDVWKNTEYDNTGDYFYLNVKGLNLDADKLWPVLTTKNGTVVSDVVGKIINSDENIVYKLKKLEKDSCWFPGTQLKVQIETASDYEYVNCLNNNTIYLDEELKVLFAYYNYKKGVTEIKLNGVAVENTEMTVNIYEDWNCTEQVASGTATVKDGMLSLKFTDSEGEEYIPDNYSYINFGVQYTENGETCEEMSDANIRWYNYYGAGSNESTVYWDEMSYKAGTKEVPVTVYISAEEIKKTDKPTVSIVDSFDEEVGTKVSLSCSAETEINGKDFYEFTGTWVSTEGLTEDIYYMLLYLDEVQLGSSTLFVYDDSKFYQEDQYAYAEDDYVALEFYSYQTLGNYKGSVSAAAALKLWNDNYKLEIFDRNLQKISGWTIKSVEYDGWMRVIISGLSRDYVGLYFRVTDKAGNLGVQLGTGETYYSQAYNGSEQYGLWSSFSSEEEGCYLINDYTLKAYNGICVNNSALFPVTITITKPYDTEPVKTFTASGSMETYYFTAADIAGLVSDEVYRITCTASNGYTMSEIGYIAGKAAQSIAVTGVTLDKTSLSLQPGDTQQLAAIVKPVNATNKTITWNSSNKDVATVDSTGKVTAVGAGTANITASSNNGKTASCAVTVYAYSISDTELYFDLSKDTSAKALTVSDGMKTVTATWTSENESVAAVDKYGKVTPVGVGETTITAAVKSGPVFTCKVTIEKSVLEAVTLSEASVTLKEGDTRKLEVYFVPVDTTAKRDVKWKSTNPAVAMVDTTGMVTAVSKGTATITAKTGDLTAECEVTVLKVIDVNSLEIPKPAALTNVQKTLADVKLPDGWRWANPEILLQQFAGNQVKSFAAVYEEEGAAPVYTTVPVTLAALTKLSVSADQTTIQKGESMNASLVWTVTGEKPNLSSYEEGAVWTSSKSTVATVDNSGVITAVGKGTAKIQATVTVGATTFKASYTVTVTESTAAVIHAVPEGMAPSETQEYVADLADKSGIITATAGNATKLTVKSSNTGVVAVGKVTAKDGTFTIPYTLKAAGTAKISITANDAFKTTTEIWLTVKDAAPSIDTASLTINRLMTTGAKFHIYPAHSYEVTNPVLGGTHAQLFTLERTETDDTEYTLTAKDGTVKGNYKVEVTVTADEKEYTFPLKVKVEEAKAKVTAKQAAKINLFYTKNKAAAVLNLTTAETITGVELKDCDFTVKEEAGTYLVVPIDKGLTTKCDTKGILSVTLAGYKDPLPLSYTVGVEKKAPKLALTSKSSVLYPALGIETAETSVTLNGENYSLEGKTIAWTDAKGKEITGYQYAITENCITVSRTDLNAKAVSAVFKVQDETWTEPVSLSYSLKINTKKPALKLSKPTLQLDSNAETMAYDEAVTQVMWKDATAFHPERITVAAVDKKSQEVLNKGITLIVDGDEILAKMNNTSVANGTYKFKVFVKASDEYTTAAALSVKVVNTAAKKAVTLSQKGTIDVLNRTGSSVTVTPTLKYINGTVTDVSLSGGSAHLFDAELVDGKVVITAKDDVNLITKYDYGLNLVLTIENAEGKEISVTMDEIKFKLKQTKPTVTASPKTTVFYSNAYNSVKLDINAAMKGAENPEIIKTDLLNYTDAFDYNAASGELTLKASGEAAKGKSYTLQFKVTFEGQADNEAPVILKYKVTVK